MSNYDKRRACSLKRYLKIRVHGHVGYNMPFYSFFLHYLESLCGDIQKGRNRANRQQNKKQVPQRLNANKIATTDEVIKMSDVLGELTFFLAFLLKISLQNITVSQASGASLVFVSFSDPVLSKVFLISSLQFASLEKWNAPRVNGSIDCWVGLFLPLKKKFCSAKRTSGLLKQYFEGIAVLESFEAVCKIPATELFFPVSLLLLLKGLS